MQAPLKVNDTQPDRHPPGHGAGAPTTNPQAAAAYVGLGLCAVVAGLAADGKAALAAAAHWAVKQAVEPSAAEPGAAELDDDWHLLDRAEA